MSEESELTNIDELIEQQLRFLSDGGPQPDAEDTELHGIDNAQVFLSVVEALVDSSPHSLPLAQDPVAIRLGLVGAPTGAPLVGGPTDPIMASIREIQHQFSIDVVPAATDGTSFRRRLECRSMVENILLVVAPTRASRRMIAVHARGAFALAEDLSAVVYTDETASDAMVMTYADCHQRLEPGSGWRVGTDVAEVESLLLAFSRYLERSDPRWEDVRSIDVSETLDGVELDATAVVRQVLDTLGASKPRLAHKKVARDRVIELNEEVFVNWARDVQQRRIDTATLVELIRAHIGDLP